jgi:hypothetical protein
MRHASDADAGLATTGENDDMNARRYKTPTSDTATRQPWMAAIAAAVLTVTCVLYLVIASLTPDGCTPANIECDGFGQLEDFQQAFGVVTALALIALAWLVFAGQRWAWITAVIVMSCIGIASVIGLSEVGSGTGVAGPSRFSPAHVTLGVLNLVSLALLLTPDVFRRTAHCS